MQTGHYMYLQTVLKVIHNVFSELQVTIDLEPEVAGNDSAAELSGLLQDPHFLVYFVVYTQSYPYSMTH